MLPHRALRPFQLMIKPIGPVCNLRCSYCYYLEKRALYPNTHDFRMPDAILERVVCDYLAALNVPEVIFAWQGGEPLLMGLPFFQRVIELQHKYAGNVRITNTLQTNCTLLNDEWCAFFKQHRFLIGASIDGPPDLHNRYRLFPDGSPSFDAVLRGINLLLAHQVDFNTLTVVSSANESFPLQVYHFLKNLGVKFMQFIPLVERLPDNHAHSLGLALAEPPPPGHTTPTRPPLAPWSVNPRRFGDFLIAIFDEWVRYDVGSIFVQYFDVALGSWTGHPGTLCVFAESCGNALVLEHNGDLYTCDHYVYPTYRLGNIMQTPLLEMVESSRLRAFGCAKHSTLTRTCRACTFRFACHGDCLKHRFCTAPSGELGHSYLCQGLKRFFAHIAPSMQIMAALLRQGRPPADIMLHLHQPIISSP
ncbi:MAG: anaerobic sulfatase maturase [bacterium]|nr:anaerobic sulfatase maturase [bacterium]